MSYNCICAHDGFFQSPLEESGAFIGLIGPSLRDRAEYETAPSSAMYSSICILF